MATLTETTIDDNGFLKLPVGTTAQRPGSPSAGMVRYNADNGIPEVYDGTAWTNLVVPSTTSPDIVFTYIDTTFRYMGQFISSTLTGTISNSAQEGDFAIAMFATDLDERSQSTPSGWTFIGAGTATENPRSYLYCKILEAGEPGSNVNVSISGGSDSYAVAISIFRPSRTLYSFTTHNFVNSKGPSAVSNTTSSSGVPTPCIAWTSLTGRTGPQTQELYMSPSADAIVVNGGGGVGSYAPTIAYTIFGLLEAPYDIGQSTNDEGRQSLSGVYVSFT